MISYMPYMLLSFVPFIVLIIIIIGIVVFFTNRNHNMNNMDPNQMKPKTTAGDFLLNIGAIIALYTVVSCLLNLLFTVINKAYPQINNGYNYYSSHSISWPVSILIVLFPIFVIIMWFLEKSYTQNPEKRNIGIHKWLSYITLFIGGAIFIGDLVTILYYFIDGKELTTGFLLKVFSVLAISLIVFLYYVNDVRDTLTPLKRKLWFGISAVIVLASIVWGFSVLGSPRTQQLIKYDQQKISDLQNIKNSVENFYSAKGVLPVNFDELSSYDYYYATKVDPQTQRPYKYRPSGDTTYNLCAEFNKASDDKNNQDYYNTYQYPYNKTNWTHPAGEYCFTETINPNTYSKSSPVIFPVQPGI